jgi:phage shock protein PspC (stress-responsive transcriptional regulator)
MSKQSTNIVREEKKRPRNPLAPIFGLIIAISLGVVAYFAAQLIIPEVQQLRLIYVIESINASGGRELFIKPQGLLIVGGILWLAMLGVAYALVAIIAGPSRRDLENKRKLPPKKTISRDLSDW